MVDYLSKSRSRRVSNPYWSRSSHQPSRRSEVLQVITFGTLKVEFDIELRKNSNLVFRFESPRGRDVFLSRPQSQDAEVSRAPNAASTNLLLSRARPTSWHAPHSPNDVVSSLITRPARHVGFVVFRVNTNT
ncbi:hypothetical protein ACFX2C_004167 [Malus domestica]